MPNRTKIAMRAYEVGHLSASALRDLPGQLFTAPVSDGPVLIYQIGLFIAQHLRPRAIPSLPGVSFGGDIEQAMVRLNRAALSRRKELIWLMDDSDEIKFLLVDRDYPIGDHLEEV